MNRSTTRMGAVQRATTRAPNPVKRTKTNAGPALGRTKTAAGGQLARTKTTAGGTLQRTKTAGGGLGRTKTRVKDVNEDAKSAGVLSAPTGTFEKENIRVAARFRPTKQNCQSCDEIMDLNGPTVFVHEPRREFHLDHVFGDDSTQEEIFDWAAKDSLVETLHGFNLTVLAYGQTGAGKTHTMFGSLQDPSMNGIIPRCCTGLFDLIDDDDQGVEFTCQMSMLEIYREELNDLLKVDADCEALQIKESRNGGVFVEGLSHEYVSNAEEIFDLIDMGNKAKVVASTKMNSESSRSHTIVTIDVVMKDKGGNFKKGRLNLVDLAGSEKVKKTGAAGQTLEEAKKINLSLTALSHCIYALTKSDTHIPFRSSKLTRFLQNSLGGNSKTTLIVACASEASSLQETISSLEFATRAKRIKNKVVENTEHSADYLLEKCRVMGFELDALKMYCIELCTNSVKHNLPLPPKDDNVTRILGDDGNLTVSGQTLALPAPADASNNLEIDDAPAGRSHVLGDEQSKGSSGLGGGVKAMFAEKISMLTGRDKRARISAAEQAELMALTPDVGLPDPREELEEEIVNYKSEIEALNGEIEAIYALVLRHEEEVGKFLEAKNLEINTLKVQLDQQNAMQRASSMVSNHQGDLTNGAIQMASEGKSPSGGLLESTKPGRALQQQSSFRKIASNLAEVKFDFSPPGSPIQRSEGFQKLSAQMQEQNQALEMQQGVLVKQQDVLALQQEKIRELQERLNQAEREKDELITERDRVKIENGELQLTVASLKRSLNSSSHFSRQRSHNRDLNDAVTHNLGGKKRPGSMRLDSITLPLLEQPAPMQRSASERVVDGEAFGRSSAPSPAKIVKPIIPKKLRNQQLERGLSGEKHGQDGMYSNIMVTDIKEESEAQLKTPDGTPEKTQNVPSDQPAAAAGEFQKALADNDVHKIAAMMSVNAAAPAADEEVLDTPPTQEQDETSAVAPETKRSDDVQPDTPGDKPSGDAGDDKPSDDKPSDDSKPSEDKPSEDKPSEDKPSEDKPAETPTEVPASEPQPSDAPTPDAKPDEATAKPDEATIKPDEAPAKPDEVTAQPDEVTAQPDEVTAKPDEAPAKPDEATAKPDEATANTAADDSKPSDAPPSDKPSEDAQPSPDDATNPSDDTPPPTTNDPAVLKAHEERARMREDRRVARMERRKTRGELRKKREDGDDSTAASDKAAASDGKTITVDVTPPNTASGGDGGGDDAPVNGGDQTDRPPSVRMETTDSISAAADSAAAGLDDEEDGQTVDQNGKPLPEGWLMYMDTDTNKPYYHNIDTGKVTWKNPNRVKNKSRNKLHAKDKENNGASNRSLSSMTTMTASSRSVGAGGSGHVTAAEMAAAGM